MVIYRLTPRDICCHWTAWTSLNPFTAVFHVVRFECWAKFSSYVNLVPNLPLKHLPHSVLNAKVHYAPYHFLVNGDFYIFLIIPLPPKLFSVCSTGKTLFTLFCSGEFSQKSLDVKSIAKSTPSAHLLILGRFCHFQPSPLPHTMDVICLALCITSPAPSSL